MDEFVTQPQPEEPETVPEAPEPEPQPEPAPPVVPEPEADEPSQGDALRRARLDAIRVDGSPAQRASLVNGGAVNQPLEGPASPFKPPKAGR